MTPKSCRDIIEMEMLGFLIDQNKESIKVQHPIKPGVTFFLCHPDEDFQVEQAMDFVVKFQSYITDAATCHHV